MPSTLKLLWRKQIEVNNSSCNFRVEGDLSTVNLFAAFLILCMNVKVKRLNVNLLKFDREV